MADLNERNMVLKAKINGKPVHKSHTDHKQNGKKADKSSFLGSHAGDSFHQQIIMDKLTHAIADKIKSSVQGGNGSASNGGGVKSSGSSGSKVLGSSAGKNCELLFFFSCKNK